MTLTAITGWLNTAIWETSLSSMHRSQAWLIQMLRILIATARDIAEGLLTLRAMGLVYTTLLSLVPLLAVSFSVLKGHLAADENRAGAEQYLAHSEIPWPDSAHHRIHKRHHGRPGTDL